MSEPVSAPSGDVVTKRSPRSVSQTVARLTAMIHENGLRLFTVIDQSDEARRVGALLRETVLVIFGNPAAGTRVMEAAPLVGVDLPLKVLVWASATQTNVSYTAPHALAARYDLSPELAALLAGIDGLTDALVAP
jgi:uncharacterized protein (DUF302 family)